MPIQYQKRIAYQDLSAGDFELEAKSEEALIILNIMTREGGAEELLTVNLGERNVFSRYMDKNYAEYGGVPGLDTNYFFFDAWLRSKYPNVPTLKVLPGKKLILSSSLSGGEVYVEYITVTGGDIPRSDEPGAHFATVNLLHSNGRITEEIGIGLTESFFITSAQNPAGMSNFPYGTPAPADYKYDWLGFSLVLASTAGADVVIDGIKVWLDKTSILAKDLAFVDPDLFPFAPANTQDRLYLFNTPIEILEGQTLQTEVRATNIGAGLQNAIVLLTHLFIKRRL